MAVEVIAAVKLNLYELDSSACAMRLIDQESQIQEVDRAGILTSKYSGCLITIMP